MKYKIVSKILENENLIGVQLICDDGKYVNARYEEVVRVLPSGNIINAKMDNNRVVVKNYGSDIEPYMSLDNLPLMSDKALIKDVKVMNYRDELLKFSIAHNKKLFELSIGDDYLDMLEAIRNRSIPNRKLEDRVYMVKPCSTDNTYILIEDLALYKFRLPKHMLEGCLNGLWRYYSSRIECHSGHGFTSDEIVDMGWIKDKSTSRVTKNIHLIMRVYDGYFGLMETEEYNDFAKPDEAEERKNYRIMNTWSKVATAVIKQVDNI